MVREETKKPLNVNCAKAEASNKSYASVLPSDMVEDLIESFAFYDKEGTGLIIKDTFKSCILHNFGFHRLGKREMDADLIKCDLEWNKRTHVDIAFAKYVIGFRYQARGGRDDEAKDCFRVFDKNERSTISHHQIKAVLLEHISPNLTDEDVKEFMREIDPTNSGHI